MYVEAGESHHRPHFHAYYQEHSAVFRHRHDSVPWRSPAEATERLVEAWVEIHRAELEHDWALLQSGQPPVKIDPLR